MEPGIKIEVFETKNKNFSASVLGHAGIGQLASGEYKTNKVYQKIRLLFENELSEKIKINYNIGTDWNEEEGQNWLYTFSIQVELTDKMRAFLEEYAYYQKGNRPQPIADAGIAYFLSKNVMLDVSGGVGLNSATPDYFISGGISFKIQ